MNELIPMLELKGWVPKLHRSGMFIMIYNNSECKAIKASRHHDYEIWESNNFLDVVYRSCNWTDFYEYEIERLYKRVNLS